MNSLISIKGTHLFVSSLILLSKINLWYKISNWLCVSLKEFGNLYLVSIKLGLNGIYLKKMDHGYKYLEVRFKNLTEI